MKITSILVAAVVAVPSVGAVQWESVPSLNHLSDETNRDLHHVITLDGLPGIQSTTEVLVFEECVGKTKAECLVIVSAVLDVNPEFMPVGAQSVDSFVENLNVEELAMRSQSSDDYYKVGLRTDYEETHIVGVLGDGMTFYPYPWCTAAGCATIGPWDCDVGAPLTIEACCDLIKAAVPTADVKGNYIDCYSDYPYGSMSKPIEQGRIIMTLDAQNKIAHPPKMM